MEKRNKLGFLTTVRARVRNQLTSVYTRARPSLLISHARAPWVQLPLVSDPRMRVRYGTISLKGESLRYAHCLVPYPPRLVDASNVLASTNYF